MKYYLDFLLEVVLALLGGVDGCGLVGAGIDDGACLDELLLDISITSDDDDFFSLRWRTMNTSSFWIVLLLFF